MHSNLRQTVETETNTTVEDYGDLIVQNLGVGLLIERASIGAGQTLPFNQRIADYDVLGDVDRYGADEAVLLCQKLRGLQMILGGADEDPTNVEFQYSFGFDNEQVDFDDQTDRNAPSGPDDGDVTILASDEVNNDTLYHVKANVKGAIEDSNGSSSGHAYETSSETNYMNEVGVLPEVSARENLNEKLRVSTTTGNEEIDSQDLKFFTNWQLYWLETDEPLEGRQIDVLE